MRPLVFHEPLAAWSYWATLGLWLSGEIWLQVRTPRDVESSEGDRGRAVLFAVCSFGVFAGIFLAANGAAKLPGGGTWPVVAGLVLAWAGIAFRIWAIRTLGRFFTCAVMVQQGQSVIDTGPYRLIRHPSYTGLITVALGLGIALDSAPAIAAFFLPTSIAFSRRCVSEEAVLARELGEPYREYMSRTNRLLPGVW